MNTQTGQLVSPKDFNSMAQEDAKRFTQVNRNLTTKEISEMQIKLYSPCGCGSGKKFKFCCKK